MHSVYLALWHAARDVTAPRMLALPLWPIGIALLSWGALGWWFGSARKAELSVFPADPVQHLREVA